MKKNSILIFIITLVSFFGCKKENQINKALEGKWTILELNNKNGVINDYNAGVRSLQFFKYKKAYSRTMKGIYRFDYTDVNKLPIVDTFEYQLKNNEFDITKVVNKIVNGNYNNTFVFFKRRFKIEGYKSNNLTLTRIDSTDLYIKATKN